MVAIQLVLEFRRVVCYTASVGVQKRVIAV